MDIAVYIVTIHTALCLTPPPQQHQSYLSLNYIGNSCMEIIKYSQLDEPVQVWMDEWLNGVVRGKFGRMPYR